MKKVRLAYLVTHPTQYQAPLLRRIAQEPDIDLTVFFCSNFSIREFVNTGFGCVIKWDVPLLDGYNYEFLPAMKLFMNFKRFFYRITPGRLKI